MSRTHLLAILTLYVLCNGAKAPAVEFDRDVLPILKQHCIDCHGPDEAESKLRLDSMVNALRGGDSGEPTIVPGESNRSHLIELVTSSDDDRRMPLDSDRLSAKEIEVLRAWIDDATVWKFAQKELAEGKTDHWSFQPIVRPKVSPPSADHSIDYFVERKLLDSGMEMSGPAERTRRIRRLYFVMHGLPPTPEQVQAFVEDPTPRAWESVVEQVLASPRYGERWATHWLDLVRFGETHGFETNRERPNAWHYRDWVINAWNDDKPYDRFVVEQIAGDAVGSGLGTGFLVAGPYDLVKGQDPQLRLMQRQDELADIINATGTAFLGLTLGCARCHNHKFDPIAQTDYYAMQAVFAGVNHADRAIPLSEETKQKVAELDGEIAALRESLAKFLRKPNQPDSARPAVNAKLNTENFPPVPARFIRFTINATNAAEPCIDELEIFSEDINVGLASAGAKPTSSGDFQHPLHKLLHVNDGEYGNARSWIARQRVGGWVQIELPEIKKIDRIVWARDRQGKYADRLATDYRLETSVDGKIWKLAASSADRIKFPGSETQAPQYDFASFSQEEAEAGESTLALLKSLSKKRDLLSKSFLVYAGTFSQPGPTRRLYRGEPGSPREEVSPGAIAALHGPQVPRDSAEKDRRLAIAHWIASPDNPLTARVLVNRLWQFHFGTGIVDTPSDFGGNGSPPTHPELLDWLAAEFIENGWSIKHMQRLILTSRTWQQDSRSRDDAMQVDAASRLLWRFPPRRLEAEGIRDCILAVTGKLDLRMGGPGFSAFAVELENVRHYFPKVEYGPADWRRMIYMTKVRQERDSVFGVFDCPDGSQVTPERSRSTTPLQALNLLNSRFVMQQAEFLVQRLNAECDSPRAKIVRAYALCFGRMPNETEIALAMDFIDEIGWVHFARAMLNANEFLFVP